MRTSSMKLTSLLLSLMLASGVLAAPVPAPPHSIPGFNPPALGSPVVDDKAPGTMGTVNAGLKGDVAAPTEEADPLADKIKEAAGGEPSAAQGLHRRVTPGLDTADSGVAGGATSGPEDLEAALAAILGERADVPPEAGAVTALVDGSVNGVKENGPNDLSVGSSPIHKRTAGPPALTHDGITDEINQARGGAGRSGKRSPDGPPINTLSGTTVAGEPLKEVVDGKKTPGSGVVGTGFTRRETPENCVKPGDLAEGANCIVGGIDANKVNDLNGATSGPVTPGQGTGTPDFAGTSSPASGVAHGASNGVPTTGGVAQIVGDATKSA